MAQTLREWVGEDRYDLWLVDWKSHTPIGRFTYDEYMRAYGDWTVETHCTGGLHKTAYDLWIDRPKDVKGGQKMVYRIVRDEELMGTGLIGLSFADDIPVEVRIAIKDAGFRWSAWNGCWTALGMGRTDDDISKMISEAYAAVKPRNAMTKEDERNLRAEYMVRIMAGENEKWRKYYEGNIGTLVRLTDGTIVNIEKPRIETQFCFGESGYDRDEACEKVNIAHTREGYFRGANLKKLKEMIDVLSYRKHDFWHREIVAVHKSQKEGLGRVEIGSTSTGLDFADEISEENRERLLEGYRKAYTAFSKRIDAYLKRYGLSKVHAWTYWRDA